MPTFYLEDKDSSVYRALAEFLQSDVCGNWLPSKENPDVVFANRNHVPFHKLCGKAGRSQLVNYYRGSSRLCRKTSLVKTLKSFCQDESIPMFDWFPMSYVIVPNSPDISDGKFTGLSKLKAIACRSKDERNLMLDASHNDEIVWIIKSPTGSKGKGIFLTKNTEKILSYVDENKQTHVAQEYIKNPLLLDDKRKFDIRCWVLLNEEYEPLMFREGVLRTASETYNIDDLENTTSHLTNHYLQERFSENYGKFEVGNEMFFCDFNVYGADAPLEPDPPSIINYFTNNIWDVHLYLTTKFGHEKTLQDTIIPQIKRIVRDCFRVVEDILSPREEPYKCFQLFGFDFIVDSNLKVWLLEINGAPACAKGLLNSLIQSLTMSVIIPNTCPDCESDFDLDASSNLFEKL